MVATSLWGIAKLDVRPLHAAVPYNHVYGGPGTAIGVMIWMNFFTVVIIRSARRSTRKKTKYTESFATVVAKMTAIGLENVFLVPSAPDA